MSVSHSQSIIGQSESDVANSQSGARGKAKGRSRAKQGPLVPDTAVGKTVCMCRQRMHVEVKNLVITFVILWYVTYNCLA